jgi:hypothetical protein
MVKCVKYSVTTLTHSLAIAHTTKIMYICNAFSHSTTPNGSLVCTSHFKWILLLLGSFTYINQVHPNGTCTNWQWGGLMRKVNIYLLLCYCYGKIALSQLFCTTSSQLHWGRNRDQRMSRIVFDQQKIQFCNFVSTNKKVLIH